MGDNWILIGVCYQDLMDSAEVAVLDSELSFNS